MMGILLTINSFKNQLLHITPINMSNNILISDHNLPILIPPYSTFSVSCIDVMLDVIIVNNIISNFFVIIYVNC